MTMDRQRGGTLLGLIVGVIFSVLVAVAVAVYVARIPVPFVDRGAARGGAPSAADAVQGDAWNPNASLGSSTLPDSGPGGTSAGSLVVPAPAPAPIASHGTTGESELAQPLPPPAEVAPTPSAERTGDPLGDLLASRGEAPQAATGRLDPFLYFVQAGAFRTQQDAEAQRIRLSLAGVQARVTEREQAGRTVYRVRIGPFDDRDTASTLQARLGNEGFDAAVVRVQR